MIIVRRLLGEGNKEEAIKDVGAKFFRAKLVGQQRQVTGEEVQEDVCERRVIVGLLWKQNIESVQDSSPGAGPSDSW